MLDGVSFDQLKAFIAAVDEGSFSAGARRLRRAQSAVSELVSNLEAQIGVVLFDRSERYPKLTPAGVVLVADARTVLANVDLLKARAKGISGGLESELSAVVDVLFPIEAIGEGIQGSISAYAPAVVRRSTRRRLQTRARRPLQLGNSGIVADRTRLHDSGAAARGRHDHGRRARASACHAQGRHSKA